MGNLLTGIFTHSVFLDVAAEEEGLNNYIFGLNAQLIADAALAALAVFVLFTLLSYLLFNPAKELLRKRQEKIRLEMETAEKEKESALLFKAEYDQKLHGASIEVETILAAGRKKALKRESDIIDEAKAEASRILDRADKEVVLEKNKMRDEVKQEMISIATLMAGKFIVGEIDSKKQEQLVLDALNEMGDETWQN